MSTLHNLFNSRTQIESAYQILELKSSPEVVELERQLDDMFKTLGLDVEFTRHFIERLLGREENLTIEEITSVFLKLKKKYKKKLVSAKKKGNWRAILKDFSSELNIVFAIKGDQLDAITIMKVAPDDFHGNGKKKDPVLNV